MCAQVVIILFILCFSCHEVSGTCRHGERAGNCSQGNITCTPGTCLDETTESTVKVDVTTTVKEENTKGCGDKPDENCNIVVTCSENCAHQLCDKLTGNCTVGCRPGYQGSTCQKACNEGYYGDGCKKECPDKCSTRDCHHESGNCLHGCKEDYWGSNCELIGEFKDNPESMQQRFYKHLSAESKSILLYILMGKYEETLERAQMEINRGIQQRNELKMLLE